MKEARVAFVAHHAADDVAMAVAGPVEPGRAQTCWLMESDDVLAVEPRQAIPHGHKIALRDLAPGQPVLKYGCPIGEASCQIHAGDHVHLHNLRSRRW